MFIFLWNNYCRRPENSEQIAFLYKAIVKKKRKKFLLQSGSSLGNVLSKHWTHYVPFTITLLCKSCDQILYGSTKNNYFVIYTSHITTTGTDCHFHKIITTWQIYKNVGDKVFNYI